MYCKYSSCKRGRSRLEGEEELVEGMRGEGDALLFKSLANTGYIYVITKGAQPQVRLRETEWNQSYLNPKGVNHGKKELYTEVMAGGNGKVRDKQPWKHIS